jgi:hypothetical protein
MIYGYVYKTTNLLDGTPYIGQKVGEFTSSYLGSGLHIKRAINKYGKQNFKVELIAYLPTKKQLDEFERFMIAKYREILGINKIYNITDGGEGSFGLKHSEETKKLWSKKRKGWTVHSKEHFSKMAKKRGSPWNAGLTKEDNPLIAKIGFQKGKPSWNSGKAGLYKPTEETIKKMKESAKNSVNPGRFKKGVPSWSKGIPHSIEHCKNISKGKTGKTRKPHSIINCQCGACKNKRGEYNGNNHWTKRKGANR